MTAFGVIKTEIPLDAALSLSVGFISSEVKRLHTSAAPETLDENSVRPAAFPVHDDRHPPIFQYSCERLTGKLRP